MKLNLIVLLAASSLVLSACGHRFHKSESCCCAKAEEKKDCADGECALKKEKSCDMKKDAEKTAK